MNLDWRLIAARQGGGILQRFLGERINRMRADGGGDQRIAFPVVEEFLGVVEGLGEIFVIGGWKIDDGFGENAAHPRFFR